METSHQPEPRPVFLRLKGETEGPYESVDVRKLLLRNEILPTTPARHCEEDRWKPVSILLERREDSVAHKPTTDVGPQRQTNWIRILCVAVIALIGLSASVYVLREKYNEQSRQGQKAMEAARHREHLTQDAFEKQAEQLSLKTKEVEDLTSKISGLAIAGEEQEARITRLQSDLKEATGKLAKEVRKSSVLEELGKALATDQQKIRQSLLPAIGLPVDIYLSIRVDHGLLKVDPTAIREAVSAPLAAAGFNVIHETPADREYLFAEYSFSQASNNEGGFAAYIASISCVGLAWQSGSARPMLLFSSHSGGYAGRNSGYSKSVLGDAAMLGEMMADGLGRIDRDALTVDYDMLDPDAELADAAAKLRELTASNEKPVAATGTGFIVSPKGLIVTNQHVIEGHDQVEIRIPSSGKTLIAQVIAADKSNDLAFLRVAQTNDLPSNLILPVIAKKPPEVGQTVFTVGFPVPEIMGLEPKYSQGVLNAHTGGRDNTRLLQHSIPIQPGNSGGFLVSEVGEVCGVVQSTLNAMVLLGEAGALPQNVNYAIKSERLWDFASDQGLSAELSEGERKPIEAKDALRLSLMITTRVE